MYFSPDIENISKCCKMVCFGLTACRSFFGPYLQGNGVNVTLLKKKHCPRVDKSNEPSTVMIGTVVPENIREQTLFYIYSRFHH